MNEPCGTKYGESHRGRLTSKRTGYLVQSFDNTHHMVQRGWNYWGFVDE